MSYEKEQQELKESIPILEEYLSTETDKTENLQRFIDKVKRITEIKELTPSIPKLFTLQKPARIHSFLRKGAQTEPFLFGGDGGISAARIASAKPKIFRGAHIFGASGTHPVGSHPHHKTKKTPKTEPFLFGGDGGIRTHVPG